MVYKNITTVLAVACFILLQSTTVASQSGNGMLGGCGTERPEYYTARYRSMTNPQTSIELEVNLRDAENDPRRFSHITRSENWRAHRPSESENSCQEQQPSSDDFFMNLKCPWEYRCDYDPQRFPAHILHAECKVSQWFESTSDSPQPCQKLYYPIPVMRTTGCNQFSEGGEWKWSQEVVAVGCTAGFDDQ